MSSTNCRICGKALTDEDSIEAGIGPVCASRLELLGAQQARREAAQREDLPEGYILLQVAIDRCRELGIPVARLIKAMGSNQMWHEPIGPEFWPVYHKGKRWLPAESLEAIPTHLVLLEESAPETEPAPKKKAKSTKKEEDVSLVDENPGMTLVEDMFPATGEKTSALDRVIAAKEAEKAAKAAKKAAPKKPRSRSKKTETAQAN